MVEPNLVGEDAEEKNKEYSGDKQSIYVIHADRLEKINPTALTYIHHHLQFDFQWTGQYLVLSLTKEGAQYPIKEMYLHLSDIKQGILEISDRYFKYQYIGGIEVGKLYLMILSEGTMVSEQTRPFELLHQNPLSAHTQALFENMV